MRNERLMKARQRANPAALAFVAKNLAIVDQIFDLLEEKGWTQKDLAKSMNKSESEISKLLSGTHNLTLMMLSNLECALGEEIIVTPEAYSKKIKTSVEVIASTIEEQVAATFREDTSVIAYQGHYHYKCDGKSLAIAQVNKFVGTKAPLKTVASTRWTTVKNRHDDQREKTA